MSDLNINIQKHPAVSGDHGHGIQQNQLRTAIEVILFNQWKAAEQRIACLEATISLLQSRLNQAGYKDDPSYPTDEAEFDGDARDKSDVNKETKYIAIKSKRALKKRKASNIPEISPQILPGTISQTDQQRRNREMREQAPQFMLLGSNIMISNKQLDPLIRRLKSPTNRIRSSSKSTLSTMWNIGDSRTYSVRGK